MSIKGNAKENKVRVAIAVPSFGVGGAENMVAQLANQLNADFEVLLIVKSKNYGTAVDELAAQSNARVEYLDKCLGFSLKAMLQTSRKLSKFKPHIIHSHLSSWMYVFPWAFFHRKKVLHTIHNMPIHETAGVARKLAKLLYKLKIMIPVGISHIITKQTAQLYGIAENRVETVYNPVSTGKFDVVADVQKDDGTVFVNVARFSAQKNQALLVEAFAQVKQKIEDAKLILVGDGELRYRSQELVAQLGLEDSVVFAGVIPGEKVAELLPKCHVFVLPSNYEGLPLTVLEAMAAGLPIIASNVGGVPDIVNENGILVEANNLDRLVDAMIKLATDGQLRDKMAEISKIESVKYDVAVVTAQYEELYRKYAK